MSCIAITSKRIETRLCLELVNYSLDCKCSLRIAKLKDKVKVLLHNKNWLDFLITNTDINLSSKNMDSNL